MEKEREELKKRREEELFRHMIIEKEKKRLLDENMPNIKDFCTQKLTDIYKN